MEKGNKWLMLVFGTVLMLVMGLLYAWSIFRAPLNALFPDWTATQLSMTFSISMIFFCLGGFVAGKLTPKLKHKGILALCALLMLAGFGGLSFYDSSDPVFSLTLLYICYGVFGGLGIGMGYNAVMSSVNTWFTGMTGFASGILLMGFGLGGMILGSIVNALSNAMPLKNVFIILAALMFAVLMASAFILRPAAKNGAKSASASEDNGYSTGQMVATPSFWTFFFWVVLMGSAALLTINSAASISVAYGGVAVLGLIVSVFNGVGRVVFGALFDKIGRKPSMAISTLAMVAAGLCLLSGSVSGIPVLVFIGLPLVGVAYGSCPSITSAMVMKFYGAKNFGINLGTINFSLIPAALLGPIVASKLQEASGGGYDGAFIMLTILAVLSFIMWLALNAASKKFEK